MQPIRRSKQMHVLDVNQLAEFFVKSFKVLAIFATLCVALELSLPAYRYSFASFASYVRGVRNWPIRIGCGALIWHRLRCGFEMVRGKAALNGQFRDIAAL